MGKMWVSLPSEHALIRLGGNPRLTRSLSFFAPASILQRQCAIRQTLFPRRDQHAAAYAAYHGAEETLKATFHAEALPFFYLDLMATDFRYGRCGIGEQLVNFGLTLSPTLALAEPDPAVQRAETEEGPEAKKVGGLPLPALTEATSMGDGLYAKCGFRPIGGWTVGWPEGDVQVLPVMKFTPS